MYKDILPIVELDVIMIVILTIILYLYKRKFNMQERENSIYVNFIITTVIILILEVLDKVILVSNNNSVVPITKIINVIGFGLSPVVPYLYSTYLFERFNVRINLKLLKLLILMNWIISILSYKYGYIFSITELNTYNRGPLFLIPMTITYILFCINLWILYRCKSHINRNEFKLLLIFQIVPILTATIQILLNNRLLIWGSVGAVILIQYIHMQENLIKHDTLTGLLNRGAAEMYFNNRYMNKNRNRKFSLVYVDVNDFKIINDSFGHYEGDVALIKIANVLRKSFEGIGKIARMGGDEFLIITEGISEERLHIKINKIYFELEKINKTNNHDYKLKVSLGYKKFNNMSLPLNEYIKAVDALMYEDKLKCKQI